MEKTKVIHDTVGRTLTIWLGDPSKESISEETTEEVVLMKDAAGKVIGLEILNYDAGESQQGLSVETILQTGT